MDASSQASGAPERFADWAGTFDSQLGVAAELECSRSTVAMIIRRERLPGRDLAARIEERTKDLVGGPIRVSDWTTKPVIEQTRVGG